MRFLLCIIKDIIYFYSVKIIQPVCPMRQHRADLSAKGVPLRAFRTQSGKIDIRLLPGYYLRRPLASNDANK